MSGIVVFTIKFAEDLNFLRTFKRFIHLLPRSDRITNFEEQEEEEEGKVSLFKS